MSEILHKILPIGNLENERVGVARFSRNIVKAARDKVHDIHFCLLIIIVEISIRENGKRRSEFMRPLSCTIITEL